ncbi:Methionyl-tRNA formyltransferase [Candidatus Hepatincola sp. Pdp]
MKICFMGTPSFASVTLNALLQNNYNVACVYTKEPKKRGRGTAVSKTEVHKIALQHNIPCRTPKSLKKSAAEQEFFEAQKFDLAIVASYGLILPERVLNAPKYGCWNIHASLLPRWRGASPIQMAIASGDKKTGITIMQMDQGLDTGDIILQESIPINNNTTFEELYNQLANLGANLLLKTLAQLQQHTMVKTNIVRTKQNDALATFTRLLTKADGYLDFHESAAVLHRKVNAFNPFPSTSMYYKENIKVLATTPLLQHHDKPCGTILSVTPLQIACYESVLQINMLQRQGKKPLVAKEFVKGFPFIVGEKVTSPKD